MSAGDTLSSDKYVKKGFGTLHLVKKGLNKKMLLIAMTPEEYQSIASKNLKSNGCIKPLSIRG